MEKVIALESISKSYNVNKNKLNVLQDFNLTIEKGSFVALVGPSGCGKSTALLIAGALMTPDAGEVIFENRSLYKLTVEERNKVRASRIGFVFQQFHLIPYLNVYDNIALPSLAIKSNSYDQKIKELLEQFNLSSRSMHVPSQLSIGERQRVALARALINNPSLILADEPTGNLDTENALNVLSHLRQFTDTGGSVLLVTHDERAAKKADKIIELKQVLGK